MKYSYEKHVDCANYISQALCEGGIPTDSLWKPGSSAWISVKGLTEYMTGYGYWQSISYNVVQKGDIVSYTNSSHLVMITGFDGTTYRYSGHTNDRRNHVITISKPVDPKNPVHKYYRAG